MEMGGKEKICVTGAGGYVASWLVKLLLSKGYTVHGTVRNPDDAKNAHLMKLENAAENLQLFKAELLDYDGLYSAIATCSGVFHLASPVPMAEVTNPEAEILEPAVKGTQYVLKASSEAGVKRVVYVSSIAAVIMNPNWPKGKVMDESCWSDKEFCKALKNWLGWYSLSKTAAETEALQCAEKTGLEVVTVCASGVNGPLLQNTLNSSSAFLLYLLKGAEEMKNRTYVVVDVRDLAEALLMLYEHPEARGRYICGPHVNRCKDIVEKLRSIYPNYNYPKTFVEGDEDFNLSTEKLKRMGWKYRSLEETLSDSVVNFQESGLMDKPFPVTEFPAFQ